jgi:hypothetical protein
MGSAGDSQSLALPECVGRGPGARAFRTESIGRLNFGFRILDFGFIGFPVSIGIPQSAFRNRHSAIGIPQFILPAQAWHPSEVDEWGKTRSLELKYVIDRIRHPSIS